MDTTKATLIAILGFMVLIAVTLYIYAYYDIQMAKAGYTQTTIPGKQGVYWVKDK